MTVYICKLNLLAMVNSIDLAWAIVPGLDDRYFNNELLERIISTFPNTVRIKVIGYSEENRPIYRLAIGRGKKNILAWSQMHGNETTNTRAVLDLFNFLINYDSKHLNLAKRNRIETFLADNTFYAIPILNPDGAETYTRENANKVDLNRDAKNKTQKESKILWAQVNVLQPELCLNLHDQRSIFGLDTGKPATISFLAPSADSQRIITPTRKIAMEAIERANFILQQYIPGQVGRFDDSFNINCSGDYLTNSKYPTVLIEAGHYCKDYARSITRNMLLLSYLSILNILDFTESVNLPNYNKIPENRKNFADLILLDVKQDKAEESINIGLYFKEILKNKQVMFVPVYLNKITNSKKQFGHQVIDKQVHKGFIDADNNLKWDAAFLTNLNVYGKLLLKSLKIESEFE